jgi:L-rhamnose-H+ transport protein
MIPQTSAFMANAFLGVILHWLGGLAAGSFSMPYKGVKKWSGETFAAPIAAN